MNYTSVRNSDNLYIKFVTCNLDVLKSLFIMLTCQHNLPTEYVHVLTYPHTQFYVPTQNCH